MADFSLNIKYDLSLTPAEFRLVSAALVAAAGGKAFRSDWTEQAGALQQRLFAARAKQVEQWSEEILRQTPDKEPTK